MLTKIELENFQKHPKLVLELGKFTALTGPSHSGKTSVLRAIGGLLKNESAGRYITYGRKALTVKLHLDDETIVEWRKGDGENGYIIHRPDGSKQEFQKVGTEVPEEVGQVLKLVPIVLEGGQKLHVNFHGQLEAPFLISESAGYAAKVFGELTSASKIYAAVSEGNKTIRSNLALKKTRKTDLEALQAQLSDYNELDSQQLLLSEAKSLMDEVSALSKKQSRLSALCGYIEENEDLIKESDDLFDVYSPALEVDLDEVTSITQTVSLLHSLHNGITERTEELKKLEPLIVALKEAANVDFTELVALNEKEALLASLMSSYEGAVRGLEKAEENISGVEAQLAMTTEMLDQAYSELESCPSCGQELKGEAKEHLLGEVTA